MRHLILVRHAVAENRVTAAAAGIADAARRLTEEGREKMLNTAVGLWRLVPEVHAFITSPLLRAVETTELLARPFGRCPLVENDDLAPGGDWQRLPASVQQYPLDSYVALVGHEPALGELASWLLAESTRAFIPFKKGGACLIGFDGEVLPGTGMLRWALTPSQLRHLGNGE